MSTPEFCEVVESNCIAPPAHRTDFGAVLEGDRKVRTTCFKCGRPACKACSKLVTNGGNSSGPRNKRVCVECLAEMKRDAAHSARSKDNELGPKSQLVASGDTPAT